MSACELKRQAKLEHWVVSRIFRKKVCRGSVNSFAQISLQPLA